MAVDIGSSSDNGTTYNYDSVTGTNLKFKLIYDTVAGTLPDTYSSPVNYTISQG